MQEAVKRVVETKRQHPDLELEIRIGVLRARRFDAGLLRDDWLSLVAALEKFDDWKSTSATTTRCDFFYDENVRLTVHYDLEKHESSSLVTCVRKSRVKTVDVQLANSPYACRVACSTETPATAPQSCATPNFVRLKQQRSFTTKSGFRYDVSCVYQAPTLTNARQRMHEDPNSGAFEVEIELEDGTYLDDKTNSHVAESMMLKARSVVANFKKP